MSLTHYSPVLLSIPPENMRKPKGFLYPLKTENLKVFMGYRKETPGCNGFINNIHYKNQEHVLNWNIAWWHKNIVEYTQQTFCHTTFFFGCRKLWVFWTENHFLILLIIKNVDLFTHFMTVSFYTPWKQKTRGLLMFSGGKERDQWHVMG